MMLRKMGWKLRAVVHSTSTKREVAEDPFLMTKKVVHASCTFLAALQPLWMCKTPPDAVFSSIAAA